MTTPITSVPGARAPALCRYRPRTVLCSLVLWVAPGALPAAASEPELRWMGSATLAIAPAAAKSRFQPLELRPTLVYFVAGGWTRAEIEGAATSAAAILAPCGVAMPQARLHLIDGPDRYADFFVPVSRELAQRMPYPRPTVYFVRDTRQPIAFDAEAVGLSNSRTRPELANTVWITRAIRDPGVSLAHELVHVLMDSGEHSDAPRNLMRDQTAPDNTGLTPAQCRRIRDMGLANRLLRPGADRR